ncbi:hypothetical protein [Streptococcus macacae]|uniref:DUF1433 domain-containing protein n=1 Tax=Streptococcus macacae NCTC 11558 TaxID=764298 RepID=G5JVR2_9STRE|nr:hypothetical protein [Streptococcus macacae]EHJ53336.1 hypothetical protein STRMA_0918 [Streptococcus macacae NCTC 11558]SUN78728.1 membrane protein [Streptococcus macacae NCTC 11558]
MAVKKKVLISLGIATVLIIGGIIMFNPFTGKDEPKYKHEQDRMVKYLAQNYEGIKKVEFKNFEKNHTTGTWSSDAVVNNIYYITFSLNGLGGEIDVTEHIAKSNNKELNIRNKAKNINISKIEVIYFEE